MSPRFLPGVPEQDVLKAFSKAPGNEIGKGNFDNPESSASLAANSFGFFLNQPQIMPPLPLCEQEEWPAQTVRLEAELKFPWNGGRHPHLDCVVVTPSVLIGIESKRYEPFRSRKKPTLSKAYNRPCWGDRMKGYESIRDELLHNPPSYSRLDAAQLFKHAFALRTEVHRPGKHFGLRPILLYIHAEPDKFPNGRIVKKGQQRDHQKEIETFADNVTSDEVIFINCTYKSLLDSWARSENNSVHDHSLAVKVKFFL